MRSEFTALAGDIPLDLKMRTLFFSLCGRLAVTPRRLGLEDKLDLSVKLAMGLRRTHLCLDDDAAFRLFDVHGGLAPMSPYS